MTSITCSSKNILILLCSLDDMERGNTMHVFFSRIGLEHFCSILQLTGAHKKKEKLVWLH